MRSVRRQGWPGHVLVFAVIALLHVGTLYALHTGLIQRAAAAVLPPAIMVQLFEPQPVSQAPKPLPPTPPARPAEPVAVARAPVPMAEGPASELAISLPPAPPDTEPVPGALPAQVAEAGEPLPAVVTPPPVEPAPVVAPRFDAAYLNNPAPAYPGLARQLREQGRVVLRVRVSETGQAQAVELHAGSGSPRLDEAAREAVRRWRFVPARQGDEQVAAWVLVPISFRLNS